MSLVQKIIVSILIPSAATTIASILVGMAYVESDKVYNVISVILAISVCLFVSSGLALVLSFIWGW